MATISVVIILSVAILGGVCFWYYESLRLRRKKFAGRNELSDRNFYEKFVEIKGNAFSMREIIMAREKIASKIGIPKLLLKPDDSVEILGPAKGWEYDDELYCHLNVLYKHCKKKKIEIKQCNCLADIIELSLRADIMV